MEKQIHPNLSIGLSVGRTHNLPILYFSNRGFCERNRGCPAYLRRFLRYLLPVQARCTNLIFHSHSRHEYRRHVARGFLAPHSVGLGYTVQGAAVARSTMRIITCRPRMTVTRTARTSTGLALGDRITYTNSHQTLTALPKPRCCCEGSFSRRRFHGGGGVAVLCAAGLSSCFRPS